MPRPKGGVISLVIACSVLASALVLGLAALRVVVYEPFNVPQQGMYPSLRAGEHFLVDKLSYRNGRLPERGDVVTFPVPGNPGVNYVKRVVALAGDRLVIRGNVIEVNGEALRRCSIGTASYQDVAVSADDDGRPRRVSGEVSVEWSGRRPYLVFHQPEHAPVESAFCGAEGCVVPQGQAFVLGDNRDNSADSRFWGYVPTASILGKVRWIYLGSRWRHDVSGAPTPDGAEDAALRRCLETSG
jgi:signal peptidase I